jgi:hemoglobin
MSEKPPICAVAVRNLVTAFYTRVRRDHVLAPVFARAVGTSDAEWEAHIAQMEDIWSSAMLAGGLRRRKPMPLRARLPYLEPALLERWLSLFGGTCSDLFEPEIALAFQTSALRIAAGLRAAKAP